MTPLQPPRPLSSLARLRGEAMDAHQMLLLYAMLGPKRSARTVARILRRGHSTAIHRARTYEWERRVRETAEADLEAWRIYRAEHLHRRGGRRPLFAILAESVPLVGVLARIDIAGLPPDPEDDSAPDEVDVSHVPEPAQPPVAAASEPLEMPGTPRLGRELASTPHLRPAADRVEAALSTPAPADPEAPAARSPERGAELVEVALDYFMERLRAKEVPVRMSDLPRLLQALALLRGDPTERIHLTGLPGAELPETIRLRNISDPRERLRVMREDLAEIASILDAIAASEEQAPVNAGLVVDTTAADPPLAAEGGG
jgi:hypothetical protein